MEMAAEKIPQNFGQEKGIISPEELAETFEALKRIDNSDIQKARSEFFDEIKKFNSIINDADISESSRRQLRVLIETITGVTTNVLRKDEKVLAEQVAGDEEIEIDIELPDDLEEEPKDSSALAIRESMKKDDPPVFANKGLFGLDKASTVGENPLYDILLSIPKNPEKGIQGKSSVNKDELPPDVNLDKYFKPMEPEWDEKENLDPYFAPLSETEEKYYNKLLRGLTE